MNSFKSLPRRVRTLTLLFAFSIILQEHSSIPAGEQRQHTTPQIVKRFTQTKTRTRFMQLSSKAKSIP